MLAVLKLCLKNKMDRYLIRTGCIQKNACLTFLISIETFVHCHLRFYLRAILFKLVHDLRILERRT